VSKTIARHARSVYKLPAKLQVKDISIADIKFNIQDLSADKQQELLDFLLLLRQQKKDTPDAQRNLLMWCDSLNAELGKTLGNKLTFFPPALNPQAKKFLKEVSDFSTQCDLEIKNTKDSKVLYNLMATVMVSHATVISAKIKIPLTMKLVLQTTSPLVSLFDNLFPGYVKSGLVKKVLFARQSSIIMHGDDDED
jgi:hypothetical protein